MLRKRYFKNQKRSTASGPSPAPSQAIFQYSHNLLHKDVTSRRHIAKIPTLYRIEAIICSAAKRPVLMQYCRVAPCPPSSYP